MYQSSLQHAGTIIVPLKCKDAAETGMYQSSLHFLVPLVPLKCKVGAEGRTVSIIFTHSLPHLWLLIVMMHLGLACINQVLSRLAEHLYRWKRCGISIREKLFFLTYLLYLGSEEVLYFYNYNVSRSKETWSLLWYGDTTEVGNPRSQFCWGHSFLPGSMFYKYNTLTL